MTEWIFQSGLSNIIVGAIEDEKAVGAAVLSGEEKELLGGGTEEINEEAVVQKKKELCRQ